MFMIFKLAKQKSCWWASTMGKVLVIKYQCHDLKRNWGSKQGRTMLMNLRRYKDLLLINIDFAHEYQSHFLDIHGQSNYYAWWKGINRLGFHRDDILIGCSLIWASRLEIVLSGHVITIQRGLALACVKFMWCP
jgi:hypothetical protein